MAAKIVHLTSCHSARDVRIFHKECRALAAEGYDVTLIAPHTGNEVVEGVKIRAVPRHKSRLERMTRTVWRVYREAAQQHGAIYHFHDPDLIPAALMLRACRRTVIYDVHENVPEQIRYMRWLPSRLRGLAALAYERVENFAARRFDALVAANPEIVKRIAHLNARAITVSNYPVLADFPSFCSVGPQRFRSGIVADFGGISERTCVEPIMRALALLPAELKPRLVLGGRSVSAELERRVLALPGWTRVNHVGRLDRTRMMQYLLGAAAVLVLYAPEPNNFGVGSNRLFEAMAAGAPVVTANFANWRQLIETLGCGIAVDPLDPEAIAAAITHLLSHPAQAAEMGRRSRQAIVQELNWSHEEPKLLRLYRELLQPMGKAAHPC